MLQCLWLLEPEQTVRCRQVDRPKTRASARVDGTRAAGLNRASVVPEISLGRAIVAPLHDHHKTYRAVWTRAACCATSLAVRHEFILPMFRMER